MLTEQAFEMGGDLPAIQPVADQWPEPIARGQVLDGDDLPAALTVFGGVAGPGQSRPEPVNVFHGMKLIPPIILHQYPELTTREALGKAFVEFTRALRAHPTMVQLPQERIKLRPVQRH